MNPVLKRSLFIDRGIHKIHISDSIDYFVTFFLPCLIAERREVIDVNRLCSLTYFLTN